MARKLTVNFGANAERSAWLAMLRRDRRRRYRRGASECVLDMIDEYIKFGLGRNERYAKKPGTLKGRR